MISIKGVGCRYTVDRIWNCSISWQNPYSGGLQGSRASVRGFGV